MSNKMSKDIVPEGFTLPLVMVDAIPVIFFAINMILIGMLFKSTLFIVGSVLCFYAGFAKVIWKLIVVLKKKNIWFLFIQMRIVMPIGFLLIILAVILKRSAINMAAIMAAVLSLPACIFILMGILGMVLMMVFAFRLDSSDLKSNWIEQLTNGISQTAFCIAILIIMFY